MASNVSPHSSGGTGTLPLSSGGTGLRATVHGITGLFPGGGTARVFPSWPRIGSYRLSEYCTPSTPVPSGAAGLNSSIGIRGYSVVPRSYWRFSAKGVERIVTASTWPSREGHGGTSKRKIRLYYQQEVHTAVFYYRNLEHSSTRNPSAAFLVFRIKSELQEDPPKSVHKPTICMIRKFPSSLSSSLLSQRRT